MHFKTTLSIAACALALAGLTPTTARACGGFFCNNNQPVNQAAERIIFAQNADGTTTAVIEIQYEGPSEEFAWILPVQGRPDIAVSSTLAFDLLQAATNPTYTLTTRVEGECAVPEFDSSGGSRADASAAPESGVADAGFAPPPVTVVDSGSVGPYDFVIINLDPDAEDVGALATDWLVDNDYDVSDFGRDRLVPYLESGMNLLAFRLTKGRNAGEIRPVRLSFGEGLPSIPLRPTAAAATPDMGILVWVLGEARAIPANYRDLELNEARLNWFNPNTNYRALVTAAANEAGGQGFVTEMAGDAEPMRNQIFSDFDADQITALQDTVDQSATDGNVLRVASFAYGGLDFRGQTWDGFLEVIRAEVPKPESVSEDEWIQNTGFYLNGLWSQDEIEGFDRASFVERISAEVVEPMRETAELFEAGRTMTRFFTTMSSDEMTVDPVFDFNADLPDYSNSHTRSQVIECAPSVFQNEAPWRVEFEDGIVVRGSGFNWPINGFHAANLRVRRIGTEGMGEVITDNTEAIRESTARSNERFPPPPPGQRPRRSGGIDGGGPSASPGAVSGGSCAAGGSAGSLASLLLLTFFARRRRDGATQSA
ncbi:MAG: DUF2330 domain-containing protein [Myxococcota bacterium]